jgi:hypothetical protein
MAIFHVICRRMEDFVTWVDTSKLKRTVMRYNDQVRLHIYIFVSLAVT